MIKTGFPPTIIRSENQFEYYLALEEADKGDTESFIRLVAEEEKRSIQIVVEVLKD